MRSLLPKVLFYYSAIASFLIMVSTIFTSYTITPVIFAILFLPVTAYFVVEFFKQMRSIFSPKITQGTDMEAVPRKSEFWVITLIFLVLVGIGVRNIYAKQPTISSQKPTPQSEPLIFKVQPSLSPASTIKISITDGSVSINVRQKPTVYSEKIGEAKDGDTFEMISKENGWYKIKFNDIEGYISSKYVSEIK